MRKDLDQKLVNEFPLLYSDRRGDKRRTLMCWGFSCGGGWYELIYELSEKLESLIREWVDKHPEGDCGCGCPKLAHPSDGKCITVHHVPFKLVKYYGYTVPELWKDLTVRYPTNKKFAIKNWWRNFRRMWWHRFASKIDKYILLPLFNLGWAIKKVPCGCEQYVLNHPRAMQVKEKFGTLRFYMTHYPKGEAEEWFAAIREAEEKSGKTCEICGKPGELGNRSSYWISTECQECRETNAAEKIRQAEHEAWVAEQRAKKEALKSST
jgi:hypothetical protein